MKMAEYLSSVRANFRAGRAMLRSPVGKHPEQWAAATEKEPDFSRFVYRWAPSNQWADFAS